MSPLRRLSACIEGLLFVILELAARRATIGDLRGSSIVAIAPRSPMQADGLLEDDKQEKKHAKCQEAHPNPPQGREPGEGHLPL